MAPNFKTAVCVYNNMVSSTYQDVVFESKEPLEFLPGQYLTCKVAEDRLNSYSIAGKLPDNKFGMIVDTKPGGPGSHYFAGIKPGAEMPYLGPFGKFVLQPDDGSEHLIMLGTGSGIAPLKCMIEAALREHQMSVPISLYFGLRHREDIFWDGYFRELEGQYENFKFKMCLSKPDETWQGLSGHITDFIRNEYPEASRFSAYLCGAEAMIKEASGILAELGMPEGRIYHEKFW